MTGRSETSDAPLTDAGGVRRALLLVGSPKMHNSTSHSLGAYLFEQLSAQNIETETIFLHAITRSPAKTEAMLEAVDAADLVALAFPLYIDSLPAPAIAALERIAARSRSNPAAPDPDGGRRPLFAAIANCGFPELSQNATALAICETFARQAGCAWASSLALGGGGWIDGKPLTELGARTTPIRKALDLAAEALAQGRAIPREAQDNLARAVMPAWAYRFINLGWRLKARQYGAARSLRAQPYKEMRP